MNQTDQDGSTSLRREPGSVRRAVVRLAVMLAVGLAIYVAEKKGWLPSNVRPSTSTSVTPDNSTVAKPANDEFDGSDESAAASKTRGPITIGPATDPEPQDSERTDASSQSAPASRAPSVPTAPSGSTATTAPTATAKTVVIRGQTIRDEDGKIVYQGDVDITATLARIRRGESFPHRNDGSVFQNREGRLPRKPTGYYTEYVHPTPKLRGPGPQRIILGKEQECYYTADHYRTFQPIVTGKRDRSSVAE
ncbi:MAG: ribonuclease domain-containing protein [Planctomycetota bacterium]